MRRAILAAVAALALPPAARAADAGPAVGPQYDTAHIYVAPADLSRFSSAFIATFGGSATPPAVTTVTPTPSKELWSAIRTPSGLVSLFGFQTGAPYPFGQERTGYLVQDMDAAIKAARAAGAEVIVAPFPDPIGADAIVRWPGGVNMQFYIHTAKATADPLPRVPENRVYLSPDSAAAFVRAFLAFSRGRVVSDDAHAPGADIGRPGESFREIRITSGFGKLTALITDGHLPYPYGRETTGMEVAKLSDTLAKAKAAGVTVLAGPYTAGGREAAMLQFPGGPIFEVHDLIGK